MQERSVTGQIAALKGLEFTFWSVASAFLVLGVGAQWVGERLNYLSWKLKLKRLEIEPDGKWLTGLGPEEGTDDIVEGYAPDFPRGRSRYPRDEEPCSSSSADPVQEEEDKYSSSPPTSHASETSDEISEEEEISDATVDEKPSATIDRKRWLETQ